MHEHAAFIEQIGGAGFLSERLKLRPNVTGNWRKQGVPWRYRNLVARIAVEKGVPVPAGFVELFPEERVA